MLNRATDYGRSFADGALQDPGLRDYSGIVASAATPWLVAHDDTLSSALFTADGLTIPGWIMTFALGLALLLSGGTNHLGVAAGMIFFAYIFFAYAVLIGLIIAILANLFVRSAGFDIVLTTVGMPLFAGSTAFDAQRVQRLSYKADEACGRSAILNLFLFLPRFTGERRR